MQMEAQATPRKTMRIAGLGAAIRRRRRECHLTQEQLAERTGVHSSHVSFIENDLRYPSWETLCALSVALDIKLSLLVREAEEL